MALEDFPARDLEEQLRLLETLRKTIDEAGDEATKVYRAGRATSCDLASSFEDICHEHLLDVMKSTKIVEAALAHARAREIEEEARGVNR